MGEEGDVAKARSLAEDADGESTRPGSKTGGGYGLLLAIGLISTVVLNISVIGAVWSSLRGGEGLWFLVGIAALVIAVGASLRAAWIAVSHDSVTARVAMVGVALVVAFPGVALTVTVAWIHIHAAITPTSEELVELCNRHFVRRAPREPVSARGFYQTPVDDIHSIMTPLLDKGFEYVETDRMQRPRSSGEKNPATTVRYYWNHEAFWILSESARNPPSSHQRFSLAPLQSVACEPYREFARTKPHIVTMFVLKGLPQGTCLAVENVDEVASQLHYRSSTSIRDRSTGELVAETRFEPTASRFWPSLLPVRATCSERGPRFDVFQHVVSGAEARRAPELNAQTSNGHSGEVARGELRLRQVSSSEEIFTTRMQLQSLRDERRRGVALVDDGIYISAINSLASAGRVPHGRHELVLQTSDGGNLRLGSPYGDHLLFPTHIGSHLYVIGFQWGGVSSLERRESMALMRYTLDGRLESVDMIKLEEDVREMIPLGLKIGADGRVEVTVRAIDRSHIPARDGKAADIVKTWDLTFATSMNRDASTSSASLRPERGDSKN